MNKAMATNQVTLDQFRTMTAEAEDTIPADQLRALRDEIRDMRDDAAALGKRLAAGLLRRYEPAGRAALTPKKDTGSASFTADGQPFKFEIPKKVEWNQELLRKAVEQLIADGENPDEYVKITVEVSEAKYNAWPEKIKSLFKDARTTSHGTIKVDFKD